MPNLCCERKHQYGIAWYYLSPDRPNEECSISRMTDEPIDSISYKLVMILMMNFDQMGERLAISSNCQLPNDSPNYNHGKAQIADPPAFFQSWKITPPEKTTLQQDNSGERSWLFDCDRNRHSGMGREPQCHWCDVPRHVHRRRVVSTS